MSTTGDPDQLPKESLVQHAQGTGENTTTEDSDENSLSPAAYDADQQTPSTGMHYINTYNAAGESRR